MADAQRGAVFRLLLLTIRQLKALAKKLFGFQKLRYTCYEFGHTWTPSCRDAAFGVLWSSLKASLKIYSTVYLVTALIKRRKLDYYLHVVWKDILRSTAFLTANAFCFIGTFCSWRKVVGFYCYYFVPVCAIPLNVCLLHIEPRKRHGMLALYTTNLALETLCNMLTDRGILPRVPFGEVILFSSAMSGFLHLFRTADGLDSFTKRILIFIFGTDELAQDLRPSQEFSLASLACHIPQYCKAPLARFLSMRCFMVKHARCTHRWGCLLNSLEKFLRGFGIGYGLNALLQIPKMIGLLRQGKNPIGQLLSSPGNYSCGLFLATLSSIHQAISCSLRWVRGKTQPNVDGLISGAVAGLSLYFYRSSAVSLYVFIRLIDLLVKRLSTKGWLPTVENGYVYLYTLTTALLFHAAIWSPHNIRPPYWKFMLNITGGKFKEMNRRLIDKKFGTDCSRLYPDFWPNYDARFTDLLTADSLNQLR
ncbi:transmembrane protein 135-like isoform X2 [Watersipora subatra]|uniref:transmembrane protein 135-like isoform X2 n=1 Tax=Watersipora subatra TaxID=2589382 RepID=UPI00355B1477